MKEKRTLIQKIKQFLGSLRLPKHFNKKGPKKYTVKQHVLAWLVKQATRSSFRLNSELCSEIRISKAHFTTLGKAVKRYPKWLWNKISSFNSNEKIVALDATGLERSSPSHYYHWRINSQFKVKKCIKLSIVIGINSKRVLRAHVRARPRHDALDAKKLITDKRTYLADKGYNSEKLFKQTHLLGGVLITPPKKTWKKGFYRKKMQKLYNQKLYGKRNNVESVFSGLKRRFGSSVMSRTFRLQRAEILSRIAVYNVTALIYKLFSTKPVKTDYFFCFIIFFTYSSIWTSFSFCFIAVLIRMSFLLLSSSISLSFLLSCAAYALFSSRKCLSLTCIDERIRCH